MKPDYKLVAKAKYIHMTADLASEVWHEVYKRYFPAKQLDALIENLQSADSIEEDIDNDVNYFLVFLGSSLIGYFAWKMENTSLHLLHLYLKPEYRGKAIGRDIVASCERLARGEGRGRVSSSSRPGATAPSALPRVRAASSATSLSLSGCCKFPAKAIAFSAHLYYTKVVY